jgi:hypothetical protein
MVFTHDKCSNILCMGLKRVVRIGRASTSLFHCIYRISLFPVSSINFQVVMLFSTASGPLCFRNFQAPELTDRMRLTVNHSNAYSE